MKDLRRNFERFCYRHRDKGIRNLMLYVVAGTVLMYLMYLMDPSQLFYRIFCFNRSAILRGQVWRLVTYIFLPTDTNVFFWAISLYFYYFIGKSLESQWGPFRFNLFYFSGIILTDLSALILGFNANISNLNLSLLLAFATMYPENRVLLLYVIPVKLKYVAWFYFALIIYELLVYPLADKIFVICALLNYLLFFGSEILQILPDFLRPRGRRRTPFGDFGQKRQKPNPNWAKEYQKHTAAPSYRHKCTVCGKTDTEYPDMEFRYCSRCNGYYCYCMEHINNHAHIQ